jgi:hypothetical protein
MRSKRREKEKDEEIKYYCTGRRTERENRM